VDSALRALLDQGSLFTAGQVRAAGVSQDALRWSIRTGELRRLRRGVYVTRRVWDARDERGRHLLLVRAGQTCVPGSVAVSESAAVALGLPRPKVPAEPRLLLPRAKTLAGGRGREGGSVGRRSWLDPLAVWTTVDGIRVTAPARTVVDCARHLDRPWSLAVADAACRLWALTRTHLLAAAAVNPHAPGHPAAVWLAGLARFQPESALESLARAVVTLGGHPEPTPQVCISTRAGVVRVDLMDVPRGVVIEADGRGKYLAPEDLWREKRREDAVRDLGFEVIRFVYADYRAPQAWLEAYRRALSRAAIRTSPVEWG
jgi:Transcriptional regulator, AbiEi antitoxin